MSVEAKKLIDLTRLSRFKELMDQSVDGKLSALKLNLVQVVSALPEISEAEEGVLYLVPAKASGDYDPKLRKPDISRAKDILKWEPIVDLNTGLDKTITDIKAQLDNEANEIKNIEILNHMQNIINERFMRVK